MYHPQATPSLSQVPVNKVLFAQHNTHSSIDHTTQESPVSCHMPYAICQRKHMARQPKELFWIFTENIGQLFSRKTYINAHGCHSHYMRPSCMHIWHNFSQLQYTKRTDSPRPLVTTLWRNLFQKVLSLGKEVSDKAWLLNTQCSTLPSLKENPSQCFFFFFLNLGKRQCLLTCLNLAQCWGLLFD